MGSASFSLYTCFLVIYFGKFSINVQTVILHISQSSVLDIQYYRLMSYKSDCFHRYVGVCVYIYIYVYMCIYIYIYIYTYTHTQLFILYWLVCLVAKSCLTLVTPWTVARQAPLSMGFSRQAYWSGLPFPSPGDLPDPGIEPRSPALQADSLPTEYLREALLGYSRLTTLC